MSTFVDRSWQEQVAFRYNGGEDDDARFVLNQDASLESYTASS